MVIDTSALLAIYEGNDFSQTDITAFIITRYLRALWDSCKETPSTALLPARGTYSPPASSRRIVMALRTP